MHDLEITSDEQMMITSDIQTIGNSLNISKWFLIIFTDADTKNIGQQVTA
jgi:hypothetical protein